MLRIAATADLHCEESTRNLLKPAFQRLNEAADLLLLAGDLTCYGTLSETEVLIDELSVAHIPVVAVLGNHDYHSHKEDLLIARMRWAGMHVLNGEAVEFEVAGKRVGVAGAKGFCGGFGVRALPEFGEQILKELFQMTAEEAAGIESGLSGLNCDHKIVLLHYVPVVDTLLGEPPEIWPWLGSSILAEPADRLGADLVVHGHAHFGREEGTTPTGLPVRNVAVQVTGEPYVLYGLEEDGRVTRLRPRPMVGEEALYASYALAAGERPPSLGGKGP